MNINGNTVRMCTFFNHPRISVVFLLHPHDDISNTYNSIDITKVVHDVIQDIADSCCGPIRAVHSRLFTVLLCWNTDALSWSVKIYNGSLC